MTLHEFLTNEGAYTHEHIWEGECDVYRGDSHVLIYRDGLLVEMYQIDWDLHQRIAVTLVKLRVLMEKLGVSHDDIRPVLEG